VIYVIIIQVMGSTVTGVTPGHSALLGRGERGIGIDGCVRIGYGCTRFDEENRYNHIAPLSMSRIVYGLLGLRLGRVIISPLRVYCIAMYNSRLALVYRHDAAGMAIASSTCSDRLDSKSPQKQRLPYPTYTNY
jgi:hypothetical protein